ncbi:snaclec crotocetin-like isoform X4 [Xiphias gladius]|uniref:snaclec crotocetin-like isoform X4 n=1 Tax=Xiphias gladius TaxID=8245 RepID=UPI001A980A70|nr:snaclec crotocetin-like isoform X4 [Xiphias gladius]
MATGDYVNSPLFERRNRGERRENNHSGESKLYRLVGVSFGLLCILQSALNVSLRLHAEENNPRCPLGWWTYNSSCYQLSSTTNTWEYARKDCVRKGAHLVILNNKMEERVVRILGGAVKMWMGLSGQKNPVLSGWTWTWVDGSLPSFTNWNDVEPDCLNTWAWSCAYIDESRSHLKNWFLHTCQEHHYWMCEKECSNI